LKKLLHKGGYKMIKVASKSEIKEGQMKKVEIQDKEILLVNVKGKIYAIENKCCHVGGPLNEGILEGNKITCPWHRAQYDVTTGEATEDSAIPGLKQTKFEVKEEGEDILVKI